MVIIALFLVGLFIGARLGVFSLAVLEFAVCSAAILSGLRAGLSATMIRTSVAGLSLCAGFVFAILISYILYPWLSGPSRGHAGRLISAMRSNRPR